MSEIKVFAKDYPMAPIEKFIPYSNNARTHSKEQINKLRSIYRGIGYGDPVEVDEDFTILSGHGRVEAAKAEGMTELPYVMLAGFDEKELASLFETDSEGEQDDFDVDEELEKPCFSKEGDIWHLGAHTVICGDSTEPETYKRLLGDTKVNLVCTDPPYLVALESSVGKIKNDDLDDERGYEFLKKAFDNFHEAMAKDASIYIFYATMKARVFYDAYEDAGFKVGAGLIWKKPRAPLMRTDWKFNMEPLIWGWRKDGKHIWYGDQKQKAVFEFDGIKNAKEDGCGHPSSKPVPLIAYLIKQCTQTNGMVLDGFLGSASTLIACEQLGRVCFGIELEPKFVDVAVERFRATNPDAEVYVERDGENIKYEDVPKPQEDADGE